MKVLDASVILAVLQGEVESELLELRGNVLSSVNFAEVVTVLVRNEKSTEGLALELKLLGIELKQFTPLEAQIAGELYELTKSKGLSLGDRSCLAVAKLLGVPVVTTESIWRDINHGVSVETIK